MDFPIMYASGVNGTAGPEPDQLAPDLEPLFDMIVKEVRALPSGPCAACELLQQQQQQLKSR